MIKGKEYYTERRFQIKSMYVKLVVMHGSIIWFSGMIAFALIFFIINSQHRITFDTRLIQKANEIRQLNDQNLISTKEVFQLMDGSDIEYSFYSSFEEAARLLKLSGGRFEKAVDDKTIIHRGKRYPYCLFELNGEVVALTINPANSSVFYYYSGMRNSLLFCAIFASVLSIITSKLFIKPIRKVTNAMKDVAKGNFDIELKTNARDEIAQLVDNFNIMTKELKNIEFLRKDFISNVSHEFKTPMTSIKGFASLIKNSNIPKEQLEEYADIIIKETERLSSLSKNLLKLSELDSIAINSSRTFLLDEQLRNIILLLESQWSKKDLELDIDLEEISYTGDDELLSLVWINLIQNAIKFTKPGGWIGVSLKKNVDEIIVQVSDKGIGIEHEDQGRVFERLYKGDRSRSNDGNGLGLSIAKKVVELCHGTMEFESEPGKGTIFTVILPVLEND